jgi:hypothetical protein
VSKLLWTLRENRDVTPELWHRFKEKAIASGHSPTAAVARLLHRYLAKGFDDGQPEAIPQPSRPDSPSL